MADRNYLREAQIHELLSGVFGWAWIIGSIVGIGWFVASWFTSANWWTGVIIFVASQMSKSIAGAYIRESKQAIAEGVATGKLFVDSTGLARRVDG